MICFVVDKAGTLDGVFAEPAADFINAGVQLFLFVEFFPVEQIVLAVGILCEAAGLYAEETDGSSVPHFIKQGRDCAEEFRGHIGGDGQELLVGPAHKVIIRDPHGDAGGAQGFMTQSGGDGLAQGEQDIFGCIGRFHVIGNGGGIADFFTL